MQAVVRDFYRPEPEVAPPGIGDGASTEPRVFDGFRACVPPCALADAGEVVPPCCVQEVTKTMLIKTAIKHKACFFISLRWQSPCYLVFKKFEMRQ